jgi:tripartite-type tricarboxylate transporter receptor subunit TctC
LGIDAEYYGWVGLMAPLKTPKPVVDKLRDTLKKVVENKTFIDMVETPGDEVHYLSGEELVKYMEEESVKISKLYAEMVKEGAK